MRASSKKPCTFLRVSIQVAKFWYEFPLATESVTTLVPAPWPTPKLQPSSEATTWLPLFISHSKWQVLRACCLLYLVVWESAGDGVHLGCSIWAPGPAVSKDCSCREAKEWKPRWPWGRWDLAFLQDMICRYIEKSCQVWVFTLPRLPQSLALLGRNQSPFFWIPPKIPAQGRDSPEIGRASWASE